MRLLILVCAVYLTDLNIDFDSLGLGDWYNVDIRLITDRIEDMWYGQVVHIILIDGLLWSLT